MVLKVLKVQHDNSCDVNITPGARKVLFPVRWKERSEWEKMHPRHVNVGQLLYRRVLTGRLGHTSESPFPCTALLVQSNSLFLIASPRYHNRFRSIDWLVAGFFCRAGLLYSYQMIVVFSLPLWCFPEIFIRQKKWSEVARSGQKWPEVAKNAQK